MITRLFTPGPVQLPEAVLRAMSQPPMYHRSAEFEERSRTLWDGLARVFHTTQPVMVLAGSGTTGIEAMMCNVFAPGDHVIVVEHGRFGKRLSELARTIGLHTNMLTVSWGNDVPTDLIVDAVASAPNCKGLWLVHSETSTGVTLNLEEISTAVRAVRPDILIAVDAVTSIGIHPLRMDDWNVDAVACGSQKGLLSPPGLACVSLSQRATEAMEGIPPRGYALDLRRIRDSQERGLFTWTPPVTLVHAMAAAVELLLAEGMEHVWSRHLHQANVLRQGLRDRGYTLFGQATSNAVTCVEVDDGAALRHALFRDHGIVVAAGQDELAARLIRIGTCGAIGIKDIMDLLAALDTQ